VGSQGVSPLHFTGDERDAESGLDHTWFRQYSSTEGRWLTPDPLGLGAFDLSNPQSLNLYAYVLDNPVNLIDPLGLACAFYVQLYTWNDGWHPAGVEGYFGDSGIFQRIGDKIEKERPEGPPQQPKQRKLSPPANNNSNNLPQCPPTNANGSVVYKSGVPPASPQIDNLMLCVSSCMGGGPFRATSTSDSHPPNDPHTRGLAVDGTIPGSPSQVMQCGANCGAVYEQNEYLHPSPNATAGHYHFQLVPGRGGALGPVTPTCHY